MEISCFRIVNTAYRIFGDLNGTLKAGVRGCLPEMMGEAITEAATASSAFSLAWIFFSMSELVRKIFLRLQARRPKLFYLDLSFRQAKTSL